MEMQTGMETDMEMAVEVGMLASLSKPRPMG